MRLVVPQDFLRSARRDEFAQHLAAEVACLLDPAVQLPIGERAGTSFAKLRIAFRNQNATSPQAPGISRAFADDTTSFEYDWTEAHFRQHQGGEQSARSTADYDRPRHESRRSPCDLAISEVRNWTNMGAENRDVRGYCDID